MSKENTIIIEATGRCTSQTKHDTTPVSQSVRLKLGDAATDYLDLSFRGGGNFVGEMLPGKNYRLVIEEIVA